MKIGSPVMTTKPTLDQRYGCQLTAKVLSASAGPSLANYWLFIYINKSGVTKRTTLGQRYGYRLTAKILSVSLSQTQANNTGAVQNYGIGDNQVSRITNNDPAVTQTCIINKLNLRYYKNILE